MTLHQKVTMFIRFQKTQGITYQTRDEATSAYQATLESAMRKVAAALGGGR